MCSSDLTANVDIYFKWDLVSYTVTFDANGGAYADGIAVQTANLHLNDAIAPPAAPTREGYTFLGWNHFSDVTWVRNIALDTCEGEDLSYYAIWALNGSIVINASTFPDSAFRSYVLSNCDTDSDSYLSPAEISAVTRIDVSNKGISSLTGILYFQSLTTLYCNGNSIDSLNLENLPQLITLKCYSSQISSLRLVNLPALRFLHAYNNNLTTVALTNLPSLGDVRLHGNPDLSSLTIGGDMITLLFINGTQLDEVDLSGCPRLVSTVTNGTLDTSNAQLDQYTGDGVIYCNKGATLFTAGLPIDEDHFPDAALRSYLRQRYYDKNQNGTLNDEEIADITSIWPSSSTNIHSLEGWDLLPNVTMVVLKNAGLESIDFSGHPNIDMLVLNGCTLTSLNVSSLTKLTHLNVANNPGLSTLTLGSIPLNTLNCYGCPLIQALDLSTQPNLLKAYVDGYSEVDEDEGYVYYSWQNEDETLLGFLRVDADIDILLPEWDWTGNDSAAFTLPNGTRVAAEIEQETSGDIISCTASATVSGVPFNDSRSFCLVTFSGADVPAQTLNPGDYVTLPADPFAAGSVFEGWYLDSCYETPYTFDAPISSGFTVYAKWLTPEISRFIKLPAAMQSIENEAFSGIPAQAVIVPRTVTTIAYYAFYHSSVVYIYGFPGTRAETFADAYGFTFVPIDDAWLALH